MPLSQLIKATVIDGVAATEDRDSQNEVLSLQGADTTEMIQRGYFNDNHGSGFANTLGRITESAKIFKEEDAKTERQRAYWARMKRPFLYVKGYLFDDTDHPNAKAVAAIMKEFKKMGTPLDVQMSVEGKVKQRGENGLLKESLIRNVALTLVPANRCTGAQVVTDEVRKAVIAKCAVEGANVEYANTLMKSLDASTVARVPGFIEVVDERHPLQKVFDNVAEIRRQVKVLKAMTIGYGSAGAPATTTGGSALARESLDGKPKSVTFDGTAVARKKKVAVLKSLIKKVKAQHPQLAYEDVVDCVLKALSNQNKGE